MLELILDGGFDQGCFVRPDPDDLIRCTPAELDEQLALLSRRPPQHPRIEDRFERSPLDDSPIEGDDPGFAILSGRCDLIRSICDEPFVELASVRRYTERELIDAARMGSPRRFLLAHDDDGAWIVDFRSRSLLPKHLLPGLGPPVLPLPEGRARRRFADRIGRRHSRQPVPTDIVDAVQRPLANYLKGSNKRRRQMEPFTDILATRDGDAIRLLGLMGSNVSRATATASFHEILAGFQSRAGMQIAPESTAVTPTDLPLAIWFSGDTFRLDMDQLTWSSKASEQAAEPSR